MGTVKVSEKIQAKIDKMSPRSREMYYEYLEKVEKKRRRRFIIFMSIGGFFGIVSGSFTGFATGLIAGLVAWFIFGFMALSKTVNNECPNCKEIFCLEQTDSEFLRNRYDNNHNKYAVYRVTYMCNCCQHTITKTEEHLEKSGGSGGLAGKPLGSA